MLVTIFTLRENVLKHHCKHHDKGYLEAPYHHIFTLSGITSGQQWSWHQGRHHAGTVPPEAGGECQGCQHTSQVEGEVTWNTMDTFIIGLFSVFVTSCVFHFIDVVLPVFVFLILCCVAINCVSLTCVAINYLSLSFVWCIVKCHRYIITCTIEVLCNLARGIMDSLSMSIWRCQYLCRWTKIHIFKLLVIPVLLYDCETWTLNTNLKRWIDVW